MGKEWCFGEPHCGHVLNDPGAITDGNTPAESTNVGLRAMLIPGHGGGSVVRR